MRVEVGANGRWISNGRSGECEARNGQGLFLATVRSPLDGSAAERHIRQAVDKPQKIIVNYKIL